jgi:hypothetical protein
MSGRIAPERCFIVGALHFERPRARATRPYCGKGHGVPFLYRRAGDEAVLFDLGCFSVSLKYWKYQLKAS